jgi:hypothetical protein
MPITSDNGRSLNELSQISARRRADLLLEALQSIPEAEGRPQAAKVASGVKPMYRGMYAESIIGKASLPDAVKVMCLHCVGWERKEVTLCTARGCPLWKYRPEFAE